ncbi:MAG: hypothetical protein SOX32_08770 [Candidatus Choladocola sp.]|nr:hypothetical protein [Candidatus Choladocola sp.]
MKISKWKETIHTELQKLSKLTWKQKIGYIWDYYKPLMASLLAVIFIIYIIATIFHNRQIIDLIQVEFVNDDSMTINSEEMKNEFAEYIGGLGKNEEISIGTGLALGSKGTSGYGAANQVKFSVLMSSGDIDVLVLDQEMFELCMKQGQLADLTEVISEDSLASWENLLVYGRIEATETDQSEGETESLQYSSENPERAYGIRLDEAPVLKDCGAYSDGEIYGAVAVTAGNTKYCESFIKYLLGE